MSDRRSPSTGMTYGVMRVCETLDVPRSSFYEKKRRKHSKGHKHKKRGPRPAISDEKLLVLIKEDLASSPFIGEGYRKVWARLKFGRGIKVSRKRVLRIMRENNLLSPYRRPAKATE
jgi:putative transposase